MCASVTQGSLWKFSFYLIIYPKRLNNFPRPKRTITIRIRRISEHLVSRAGLYYIKKGTRDNWALTPRAANSCWGAGCLSFVFHLTAPSSVSLSCVKCLHLPLCSQPIDLIRGRCRSQVLCPTCDFLSWHVLPGGSSDCKMPPLI